MKLNGEFEASESSEDLPLGPKALIAACAVMQAQKEHISLLLDLVCDIADGKEAKIALALKIEKAAKRTRRTSEAFAKAYRKIEAEWDKGNQQNP